MVLKCFVENENCVYFYDGRFGIMILVVTNFSFLFSCFVNRKFSSQSELAQMSLSSCVGLLSPKHFGCTGFYVTEQGLCFLE